MTRSDLLYLTLLPWNGSCHGCCTRLSAVRLVLVAVLVTVAVSPVHVAAQDTATTQALTWEPIDSLNVLLPAGVRTYAAQDTVRPLKAWYVRIDDPPTTRLKVTASDDPADARETTSSFARDLGACVAVNGGYFTMDQTPAHATGLLMTGGSLLDPPTRSVMRDSARYEVVRAALGITPRRKVTIDWVMMGDSALQALSQPSAAGVRSHVWPATSGLGAGPMLVQDGDVHVTSEPEGFFDHFLDKHPRTAAGVTEDGALLLLVVDGRQPESAGATLDEMAQLMLELGARDAINLDGGGSSALVVRQVLLNRPQGTREEREVRSALVAFCE